MIDFKPYLEHIEHQVSLFKEDNLRIFATSSFQTNSVALLHIIATVAPDVSVYMMNTGFLFPETLMFRDQLIKELVLKKDFHNYQTI